MRITITTATPIVFFFSITLPLLLDGDNGGDNSMSDQRQCKEEQEAWRRTHGGGSCSGSGAPFSGHHRSHHGQLLLLLLMLSECKRRHSSFSATQASSNTFMYALNAPFPPPIPVATRACLMPQQLLLWALLIFKVAKSHKMMMVWGK
jgi:hypothetical protein